MVVRTLLMRKSSLYVRNGVTRMDLAALESGNNTSKRVLNQFEPIYFNVYKHKRLKVVNFWNVPCKF